MSEFLNELFSKVFNDNIILATILISIIPIIEIRGAIPFAVNPKLWNNPLTNWQALGWGLLGSSAVVLILALIFVPIINLFKRIKFVNKLACALENFMKGKAEKMADADENNQRFSKVYWRKILSVFIFVAVPLPLTGVWTGTCVALFLGLDYISTCLTVIVGNITAGIAIALILEFFPPLADYLIYIFFIILFALILYKVIEYFVKKRKNNEKM